MGAAEQLVSLVVVSYNSAAELPGCLEALRATEYGSFEVIVVDNASEDGTRDLLREPPADVDVVLTDKNLGFGRACNQGAAWASGEYLVFVNPDVRVTPGWLRTLVGRMEADEGVAIISPSTLYRDQPPPDCSGVTEQATVPGAAMLVRRSAWEALDGFDERIFLYWEDTDLCWRAWLSGWRVAADCESIVYHERGGSSSGARVGALQTEGALYVQLKLLRLRALPRALAATASASALKLVRERDPRIARAWIAAMAGLPGTLRERHRVQAAATGDVRAFERRRRAHGWLMWRGRIDRVRKRLARGT